MYDLTNSAHIDQLSESIYQQNKAVGWWDDPHRCLPTCVQLINTEIAEATEGDRKNQMDDHLTQRKMAEVELADALIRTLDLAGHCGWKMINPCYPDPLVYSAQSTATRHLVLTVSAGNLGLAVMAKDPYSKEAQHFYSILVRTLVEVANLESYDLHGAMMEKLEYNRKRSDHKRENRAKEGGKKY